MCINENKKGESVGELVESFASRKTQINQILEKEIKWFMLIKVNSVHHFGIQNAFGSKNNGGFVLKRF